MIQLIKSLGQPLRLDKKQIILALLTIAIAIALMIFPALTQQRVTVTILMRGLEAAQWKPFIAEFEQKNPYIHLEIIEAPNATNQVEDLYTSSFLLGNSPYDLVYMDIIWVPKFAAAGWLLALDNRLSPQELAEFLPGDIDGGTYQERLYRMPFLTNAGMLYYRQDLLEEGGYQPPETFEELVRISRNLQEEGKVEWGYIWQGKQYEGLSAMFVEILQGFGAFWLDPDTGEVGLDRPAAIDGVRFLRSTLEKGISPPGITTYAEEETRRLFQNGKAVFLRNWPYVFALASQDDSSIQGKFAIKPMVHAPGYGSGACLGGWGLGISSSSKHPDEAWKIIEFMTGEDIQRRYVLQTGTAPTRRNLYREPAIVGKYPYYPQLLKVVESSALRPPITQYAQASDILQRYLSAALTNRMSAKQAMEAAAKETRFLLQK